MASVSFVFQLDEKLLLSPTFKGPVFSPPIEDFYAEDGKYVDVTNYYDDPSTLADFESLYTDKSKRKLLS